MDRVRLILFFGCAVGASQASVLLAIDPAAEGRAPAAPHTTGGEFDLPQDVSTPMITLAFGDQRDARFPASAELMIFADGRVTASAEPNSRKTVTGIIPRDEWVKVQRTLFVENDLLHCDSTQLEDLIRALRYQRRRPQPGPEAAVTIIRIEGEGISREIRCHAVGLTATQLPDLEEIQRVYACQQCLQNVAQIVRAGGYEQVHHTLESVNTRLERQLPGSAPLSPDDLRLVDFHPDGTRYLQFSRAPCSGDPVRQNAGGLRTDDRFLMVSVYERPGQPLEISIIGDTVPQ